MKISNKFFFLILFSICILIPISSFPPCVSASENIEYISATDILKNFQFETIGGEPIIDDGAFNNKLRFDTQSAWLLFKDDIIPLYTIESGGSTILKYRIILRNKINIFTNVRLSQMAQNMLENSEDLLGVTYRHNKLGGSTKIYWQEYITWDHWDFGDIYNYNWKNNYFSGRIVMSFDIDDNPVPDTFGEYAEKNFDHIAVSEAGIITNTWGKMSDDMPDIIVLEPSEYESETKDETEFELGQTINDNDFAADLDPDIHINIGTEPIQSFDSSILPDTPGSSMNPKNKDGTNIWDPEEEEKSMTGCLIYYDLNALSPIVYKYGGTLTYTEFDLETEQYYTENIWDWWETCVEVNHFYDWYRIRNRDIALHGINRYLQVDMYVAFDIWTSVRLGTLTDQYEYLKLYYPEEYYDALIWSTLAGGWTGSRIEEYGKPGIDFGLFDFFGGLFGDIGGIISLIIIIAVIGIGIYIFYIIIGKRRKLRSK